MINPSQVTAGFDGLTEDGIEMETIRSGFTTDGQRVFILFETERRLYMVATRWQWLASFDNVWDACDAFEAIEMMEGNLRVAAKFAKSEICRMPRREFGRQRATMARINYLINSIERRISGLRPIRCGSKGAVEKWIPAY